MAKSLIKNICLICSVYILLKINTTITTTMCLIRGITGIPCPACGITRAYRFLLKGQFLKAMYYHPLFLLPLILLYVYKFRKDKFNKAVNTAIILVLIVYFIRMYNMFPYKSPMLFNNKGIIPRIIRIICK